MDCNKILKKSSMRYILFEKNISENEKLLELVGHRLHGLLQTHDLSNKKMAVHMKKAILPAIAVYKSMIDIGYTKEESLTLIKESAIKDSQKMTRFFQTIGKMPFGYVLFRRMFPLGTKNSFCEPGWDIKWIKNNKETIEFHAKKCLYVDIMREEECSELVPIFCQLDDYMYENLENVIWDRQKTLAYGDEVCDFRFFPKVKKHG